MFSKHHLKYSISLSVPGFSFLKLYDDLSALVYEVVNHLCFGGGLVTITCQTLATPRTVACQLLCPWDSSGKNTEVCCHFLLQELNLGLLPFRQILYPLSYEGRLYHFSCKLWIVMISLPVHFERLYWFPLWFLYWYLNYSNVYSLISRCTLFTYDFVINFY